MTVYDVLVRGVSTVHETVDVKRSRSTGQPRQYKTDAPCNGLDRDSTQSVTVQLPLSAAPVSVASIFSFVPTSTITDMRSVSDTDPTIPITPVEPIPAQSVAKEEVLELNDLQDKVIEPCTTPTDSIQSQQTELASSQMTTALSVDTTASMITVSLLPTATDSDAVDDPSVRMMLRLKHMQSDMELFRDLWKKSVEARATGAKPIPFQTSVSSTKPAVPSTPVLPIVSSACSLKVTART